MVQVACVILSVALMLTKQRLGLISIQLIEELAFFISEPGSELCILGIVVIFTKGLYLHISIPAIFHTDYQLLWTVEHSSRCQTRKWRPQCLQAGARHTGYVVVQGMQCQAEPIISCLEQLS